MANKTPSQYTVVELKEILRRKNLEITGTKAELIERLNNFDPNIWAELNTSPGNKNGEDPPSNEIDKGSTGSRPPDIAVPNFGNTNSVLLNQSPSGSGLPNLSPGSTIMSEVTQTNGFQISLPNNPEIALMVREMELLRREKELLAREVEFLRRSQTPLTENSGTSSHTTISNINLKAISDLLNDFTGSDNSFDSWFQKLEWIRENYSLNDHMLKILIPSKLKGRALDWFHSKPEHLSLSVNKLKEKMEIMFNQRPNKIALRRDFEKRKWLASEPFSDYYHDKVILANRVPVPEDEVINYIVDGIPDLRIRNQARMHCFKTTKDLLQAFKEISLSKFYDEKDSKSAEVKSSRQKPEEQKKDVPKTEAASNQQERRTVRCYNCNRPGHLATECRKEKREKGSCYECGDTSHQIKNCPKKQVRTIEKTTHLVQPLLGCMNS